MKYENIQFWEAKKVIQAINFHFSKCKHIEIDLFHLIASNISSKHIRV